MSERHASLWRHRMARRGAVRAAGAASGILAVGWLAACSGGAKQAAQSTGAAGSGAEGPRKKGGTITLAQVSDLLTTTMPHSFAGTNYPFYGAMWDTLISYATGDKELKPRPELAESWEYSPDLTQLRFTIRGGVTYHSGRPCTAADIKGNIEHAQTSNKSQLQVIGKWITQVDTPNDRTVVLKLDRPRPAIMDMFNAMRVADMQTVAQLEEGKTFNGTGPFMFKEWSPGDHWTVVKNPQYWQPDRPYLDQLVMKIAPDPQTQLINVQTSTFQGAYNVEAQNLSTLRNDKSYQLYQPAGFSQVYQMGMNVKDTPFQDKRVRQAISYLLDRKRISETLGYNFSMPLPLPWPPTSPAYDEKLNSSIAFDPQKATQLLQAAGVGSGFKTSFNTSSAWPLWNRAAQVLQADAKKVGVEIAINQIPDSQFLGAYAPIQPAPSEGPHDIYSYNLANVDMSPGYPFLVTVYYRTAPTNWSHFESPQYTALVEKMLTATTPTDLSASYQEMNNLLVDEAFTFPLMSRTVPVLLRSNVKGFFIDRNGITYLTRASLE